MFSRAKIAIVLLSGLFVLYGLLGGLVDQVVAKEDAYQGLRIFTDVLSKVQEDYVETPDLSKALKGGVHDMVEALDPYSSFIQKEIYEELRTADASAQGSPGLMISKRYGYAYVVSVVPGSSAEERGIRTGDLLESVDGRPTPLASLWEVRRRLEGAPGTSVSVRVIRSRRTAAIEMDLARGQWPLSQVTARMVEPGIGLLTIPHFEEDAAQQVSAKLKMLASSDIQGLLVDIRGAAAGQVKEAVAVADYFLPRQLRIATLRDREGEKTEFFSLTEPLLSDIRVVLLVDGGSSGAAEVFAAALVDYGLAEAVGELTDGHGAEQERIDLEDGSVLELLTKRYLRLNGQPLQGREMREAGIEPGIRSPSPDFLTNFYFEHALDVEEDESVLDDDFYRELKRAIREEQFKVGLDRMRQIVLRKAA
jgi:carboxyl-terminal processing protease